MGAALPAIAAHHDHFVGTTYEWLREIFICVCSCHAHLVACMGTHPMHISVRACMRRPTDTEDVW